MTISYKLFGQTPYPKLPREEISTAKSTTPGGDLKSISATHNGITSLEEYFSHFKLDVPVLSGTSEKNLLASLKQKANFRQHHCHEYKYFKPIKLTSWSNPRLYSRETP